MNVNDSEVMAGLLEEAGYEEAIRPDDADVIIVNTCCVRQKAEDKAIGYALGLISLKMMKPNRVIVLSGCIAEKDRNDIFRKIPFVDVVVGPGQENKIIHLIDEIRKGSEKIVSIGGSNEKYQYKTAKRARNTQAFVTVMLGCDNFCSFCIVPYVRGREVSRSKEEIIDEIEGLDKDTYKEIVLLGQNVNSYGKGTRYRFHDLLADVSRIKGVGRIRFFTSHPRDMSDDIIDAVSRLPNICEFFHLPLQSGDDEILQKMNRGYTSDHYRKLVQRIRERVPEASITSDAIAGFPGETEEQFQNTLDLIKELELDLVNTVAYSVRKGTPAEKLPGHLPREALSERLQRLMAVVEKSALKTNTKLIGSVQEVLVECKSGEGLLGRTRGNKIVLFDGNDELIGRFVKIKITYAKAWVLNGVCS